MSGPEWLRVKELFEAALACAPETRSGWLAEACDRADIRQEVESLLASHERAGEFIEHPAAPEAAAAVAGFMPASMAGSVVGSWRLVEEIGRGGMGTVWRGARADGAFEKQVAIKLVSRGLDTDVMLRRFQQERQILASLNHPAITALLDGGTTVDGLPYFVMEYVDGQPVTTYCRERALPLRARIELFCGVCDAVEYAHRSHVLHRDLKPSNILVTAGGVPKLLDFGIGKLLTADTGPGSTLTVGPLQFLTPEYASPEQVRAEPVSESSDVYSLGVLLYELVTGQRPYEFQTRSPEEIATVVCEREPARPSTAARQPQLKGDVDSIVMMALRKEPRFRYGSVADLLADLRNYLQGRVVRAARQTLRYRARKLMRHQGARTAAVMAALLVVVAMALWQNWRREAPVAGGPAPKSQTELPKAPASAARFDSAQPEAPMSAPLSVPQPPAKERSVSLKAVPLTSYPGYEVFPTLSPDATQVAFSWNGENQNNFDIYVKVVGAGDPVRVTTNPRSDVAPAWSPDGKAVAFLRPQGNGNMTDLLLVPPLGGAPERKLAEISGFAGGGPSQAGHYLAWSPDSKWLVVAHANTLNMNWTPPPILVSTETGEKRALMEPDPEFARQDVHPSFSPNGRTLAFSRRSNTLSSEIYLLDLSRDLRPLGSARQLTSENQLSIAPVWSADGREVIFISGTNPSTMGLWKIAASGGRPEPLEFGYTPVNTVARTGKRLVFSHQLIDSDIWRVDLAETGSEAAPPVRMISSSRLDNDPQFSPDGSRIAFRSTRSGNWEIHLANRDGSGASQLTSFGGPSLGPARWSPDGRQLAFAASPKGAVEFYVIEAAGGAPKLVLTDPSAPQYVNWSRDGKWIYFVSRRTGQAQSWKTPVGGGPPVQITRNGGYSARESPDGKFVYYLKAVEVGPHHLWRVPVGGGEESLVTDRLGGQFDFADGGIYSINPLGQGKALLQFFSYATVNFEQLANVAAVQRNGFSVSPDRRSLIYSQTEGRGTDLMLVDNFR